MYMFDYADNVRQFNGGEYTENGRTGDVKEGMTTPTTTNGWPSLTGQYETPNRSLSWLFGSSQNAFSVDNSHAVNHLFRLDKYNEDGTFYYSSFENFATLANDDDDNFTLYNALGSPAGGTPYYFQRGNFMPYNDLDTSNVISRNHYTAEGEELHEGDPGYNDPIYGLQGSNDFHFGMYVWADFYQPQGGQVEANDQNGDGQPDGDPKDMVFEFTGDDDMWVYIDGVLVLDLGGIHDAQSGTINFATGEVRYTDTTIDQDHTDRPNTPEWHSTTIKAQYEAARQEGSVDWNGDTFADGSNHRIQIFYMERGEGASNLKISFNLKTIPDGQLAVHKEVENYYAPQLADVTYTMQVKVGGQPYANQQYTIQGTSITGTTDENGYLTLKNDQTAVFPDLQVDDKVTVQEVGTSDITEPGAHISDKYDMSCTVTDGAGEDIPGSSVENGVASATMPGYGSIVVNVTNKATFTRPLKLVKQFSGTEGNTAPADFQATYTLYEWTDSDYDNVVDDGELTQVGNNGSIKYSQMDDDHSYTFWLEPNKNYYIAESFGEGDDDGGTDALPWRGVTAADTDEETPAGVVQLVNGSATSGDGIETITLTNTYGKNTANLQVLKYEDTVNDDCYTEPTEGDPDSGDKTLQGATFQLYEETSTEQNPTYNPDTDTAMFGTAQTTSEDGLATFSDLEPGTYWLVETSVPAGYTKLENPLKIVVTDDGTIQAALPSVDEDDSVTYPNLENATAVEGAEATFRVTVENTGIDTLPSTGSSGTIAMSAAGVATAALAGVYLFQKRKGFQH
ncbi:LPXTG cell wall anchor domain-containing protein [Olsenella uli]|uniref:SpaA isopeptide-forming pilin-related protein n=1 Tax=Olsenella uli TaxID=133926 RepID=UPI0019599B7F|nr:SpaA isopeptide-forming pilin-related protein [Olsenella uli]MBM6676274.1 LPXTG cell wall anchor domain-containing protein [Olsenella uli]